MQGSLNVISTYKKWYVLAHVQDWH